MQDIHGFSLVQDHPIAENRSFSKIGFGLSLDSFDIKLVGERERGGEKVGVSLLLSCFP